MEHISELHPRPECFTALDIEPQRGDIGQLDALKLSQKDLFGVDVIITNPP
jgi:hypothetical protein